MYIRNPRNIALLYFETYFQKIGIFQKCGWDGMGSKNGMVWNWMQKTALSRLSIVMKVLIIKPLSIISLHSIQTQFVPLYWIVI